jgi:hypothetical protein
MDLGGGSNALAGLDLTKLSDRDKQELQQFVVNESQKARIQSCKAPYFLASTLLHGPFLYPDDLQPNHGSNLHTLSSSLAC